MALDNVTPLNPSNPIPVYGVEKKQKKRIVEKTKAEPNVKAKTTRSSKKNETDLNFKVAMCAYYKAEARGFAPGFEMQDWLAAEAEIKNENR